MRCSQHAAVFRCAWPSSDARNNPTKERAQGIRHCSPQGFGKGFNAPPPGSPEIRRGRWTRPQSRGSPPRSAPIPPLNRWVPTSVTRNGERGVVQRVPERGTPGWRRRTSEAASQRRTAAVEQSTGATVRVGGPIKLPGWDFASVSHRSFATFHQECSQCWRGLLLMQLFDSRDSDQAAAMKCYSIGRVRSGVVVAILQ